MTGEEVSSMAAYIAAKIETAYYTQGLEAGQAKYRAFFITTTIYARWRADVDAILIADDCEECIVPA